MDFVWTNCFDCLYFEDCEEKESRDGCCYGESIEEPVSKVILMKDKPADWTLVKSPLHTGEHSQ